MDPNSYEIEVLHYLNPHLMWVEVKNGDTLRKKKPVDFVFEQIGIYGVLPQEIIISLDYEGLKTQSSTKWPPAALLVMKKTFADAVEIWFSPTFIDRRTSIFDDNIHKFGEITIIKANGKRRSLSERLVKSGFASFEPCRFHEELSVGLIKTKLDKEQIQDVIKQLEKSAQKKPKEQWEKSVKQQTTIHQTAQNIESFLTTENLYRHNLTLNPYNILEKKMKDLELCKDTEEEPVGRAINKKPIKDKNRLSSSNTKPVNAEKIPKQNAYDILVATKKYLEENAIVKFKENENVNDENNDKIVSYDENNDKNICSVPVTPDEKTIQSQFMKKKIAKNSNRVPKVNTDTEKCIAYGPPNFNPAKLCYKVVPKIIEDDKLTEPLSEVNDEKVEEHNIYEAVDSVVDFEITKSHLTERKISPGTSENAIDRSDSPASSSDPRLLVRSTVIQRKLELYKKQQEVSTRKHDSEISQTDSSESKVKVTISEVLQKKLELQKQQKTPEKNIHIKNDTDGIEDCNISTDCSNEPHATARSKFLQKKLESHKKQQEMKIEDTIDLSKKYSQLSPDSPNEPKMSTRSKALQKKLIFHKEKKSRCSDGSTSSISDIAKDSTSSIEEKKTKDFDSDEESYEEILEKVNQEYSNTVSPKKDIDQTNDVVINQVDVKNNVNPFKNVDANISVFVEKLVTPVLMVHTKMNKRIQPCFDLRDVNFNTHIHAVLRNMSVERPMMIQSISWFTILRGYSLFMVSPLGSGKTMAYLPAVCRLVTDFKTETVDSVGPSCIIVCATAKSVANVEKLCRAFLGLEERVISCFTGMDELHITTSLLNGCDLLICTPSMLVRLLQMTDFGVDLRRLSTFVLEDCERLSEVYMNEVKFFLIKIKEMLKTRANKELKVQYIVASRIWCDFMEPLAKKAPNSVICIGAFHECVLYSKTSTTVNYVKKENKIKTVLEFLDEIDGSKKTVIVCRSDDEVKMLEKILTKQNKIVFACNNTMTVQDLYNLNKTWSDYQEPVSGPILVCCDGNLTHLNVTDAHYLIQFSLPPLYSMFCKRFAVLNDNYPSIFKAENEKVKIKILLDDDNIEQLPKILNFVKRCTNGVPEYLNEVCDKVLAEKDAVKAMNLVPVCDNLLALGECPNFWNCLERHAILKGHDEPKEWMPKNGIITFNMIHYHTATLYSVRLLSNIVNGEVTDYPQTYSTLSLKLGMYFSKESNRKLHGIPKVGDICAVSVKQNFFVRCQIMKILSHYQKGNPNHVLIKLIDEEKLEKSRDIDLYYLPENLKQFQTNVVQVRLANIMPKDKDITFSDLAKDELKKISDKQNHYMRGHITLTIGNCVFVDTLEACQNLTSLNEIVVGEDFKKMLLDTHAVTSPEHIDKLEKLCQEGDIKIEKVVDVPKPVKEQPKPTWAYFDPEGDLTLVVLASTLSPTTFFVRHDKFSTCRRQLWKDIQKYVAENPEPVADVLIGDIVLAESGDDGAYERARVDEICTDGKVKCFFVDEGDYIYVLLKHIVRIPDNFITKMAFQAIECRLIGVKPIGDEWSDFANNWFYDTCERDSNGDCKRLYLKYFTKETAEYTGGHKYGVALIDTSKGYDVLINQFMTEANLANGNDEVKYFEELKLCKEPPNDGLTLENGVNDSANVSKEKGVSDVSELKSVDKDEESSRSNINVADSANGSKKTGVLGDSKLKSVDKVEESSRGNINAAVSANASKETGVSGDSELKSVDKDEESSGLNTNVADLANALKKTGVSGDSKLKSVDKDEESSGGNINVADLANALKKTGVPSDSKLKSVDKVEESNAGNINGAELKEQSKDCKVKDQSCDPELEKDDIETPKEPLKIIFPKEISRSTQNDKYAFEITDDDDFEMNVDPAIWAMFNHYRMSTGQKTITKLPALTNTVEIESDVEMITEINADSIDKDNKIKITEVLDNDDASENLPKDSQYVNDETRELNKSDSDKANDKIELKKTENTDALDSDDLSSECTQNSEKTLKEATVNNLDIAFRKKITAKIDSVKTEIKNIANLDSDDGSSQSTLDTTFKSKLINEVEIKNSHLHEYRKPTLIWRQTKTSIIIKIKLIGVESYNIEIGERLLKFETNDVDVPYGFEFELYGVVDSKKSDHCNKGQYIQVNLRKVINRTWLTLTRDVGLKKWIAYDVDSLNLSSDEEVVLKYPLGEAPVQNDDSDSDIDVIDDAVL